MLQGGDWLESASTQHSSRPFSVWSSHRRDPAWLPASFDPRPVPSAMDVDYGAGAMDIGETTSAAINIPGSGGNGRNDDETDYLSTSAPGEGGNRNSRCAARPLSAPLHRRRPRRMGWQPEGKPLAARPVTILASSLIALSSGAARPLTRCACCLVSRASARPSLSLSCRRHSPSVATRAHSAGESRLARKAESARQARLRHKQFVTDLQDQAAGLQARIRQLEAHCTTGAGSPAAVVRELKTALSAEQLEQLRKW